MELSRTQMFQRPLALQPQIDFVSTNLCDQNVQVQEANNHIEPVFILKHVTAT